MLQRLSQASMPVTVPSIWAVSSRILISIGVVEPGSYHQGLMQQIDTVHGRGCDISAGRRQAQTVTARRQILNHHCVIIGAGGRTKRGAALSVERIFTLDSYLQGRGADRAFERSDRRPSSCQRRPNAWR